MTTPAVDDWQTFQAEFFARRHLVIAANRGPVTFQSHEDGSRTFNRGSGGLVTALIGLTQHVEATWIACARTEADIQWERGELVLAQDAAALRVRFLSPDPAAYEGYYNVIANPLLWFLQHSMWDVPRFPVIDRRTWDAWENGFKVINAQFAQAIAAEVRRTENNTLLMLQDYHLYLTPQLVRQALRPAERPAITHFIHIPWPGPDDWSLLPPVMRQAILEGLLGADMVGFQTHNDALNFMRTCKRYLPRVGMRQRESRLWYRNHNTHVRAFPISIDVEALRRLSESAAVHALRRSLDAYLDDRALILRVDRVEPSKNVLRGFQAYAEFLETHPEWHNRVVFVAMVVPSRMELDEYRWYLGEIMAAVGRINATHGTGNWEPVRILVGENYARAVASMQRYDVLLVNSIADGMNLVAKEGPIVNERDGQLVLSERTGAREQLESAALVISPCDVTETARAIHTALTMAPEERRRRAEALRDLVEAETIGHWMADQLEAIRQVDL